MRKSLPSFLIVLSFALLPGCARRVVTVELSPDLRAAGWSIALEETPPGDRAVRVDWSRVAESLTLRARVTPPQAGARLPAMSFRLSLAHGSREYPAVAFARRNATPADWQSLRPPFVAVSAAGPLADRGWSLIDDPSGQQLLLFQDRAPQDLYVRFEIPAGVESPVLRVGYWR